MNLYPSLQEFAELSKNYNTIPVYLEMPADMETPISVYLKLVGEEPGFLLESAESGQRFGRYSFIGLKPFARFTGRRGASEVQYPGGRREILAGKPMDSLKLFMSRYSVPDAKVEAPFFNGGVGYFAYDLVTTTERVRGYQCPDEHILTQLLFCGIVIVFDHLKHMLQIVNLAPVNPDNSADSYEIACKTVREIAAALDGQMAVMPDDTSFAAEGAFQVPDVHSSDGIRYTEMVKRAKEYIAAGDAFQIVLSNEFSVPLSQHPFNLYRRLRRVNPSPYMFYLNFGEKKLVGASPELLVKVEAGKIYTCPIAGTRPRGRDEAEDRRLGEELLADEKEKAEHAMLVDLGRNDLGRVSLPGTVRVERYMQVERFSHVMHLVSLVSGQIDSHFSALDVLKACFPAGTLSGAPKARAMEIIHELEGDLRGSYGGAVGYLDFRGNMDTCITIRTMAVEGKQATVRVGAGIVYDSVPETEYQEVLHKGKALFKLMEEPA